MKKIISSIIFASLLMQGSLVGQEPIEPLNKDAEIVEVQEDINDSQWVRPPKKESDLQNWLFAAGSVVCATLAIVIVSLNPGSSASYSTSQ